VAPRPHAAGQLVTRRSWPGERLALESLGCEIPVERIYLKVFSGV
jgi:hypothetical protein